MHVVKLNKEVMYNPDDASFRYVSKPTAIALTLDNLESLILQDLLDANGELVTYDTLFSHWHNKVVTDGVLSRVISSLRNKLKKLNVTQVKLTNVPKKGYKLEGLLERISYVAEEATQISSNKLQKRSLIATVLFLILVVIGVFIYFYRLSLKQEVALGHLTNVLSGGEAKYQIAVSPSNRRLVYTATENDNSQIVVSDLSTNAAIRISEIDRDLTSASFFDEDHLALYSESETECAVKLVALNFEELNYEIRHFATCHTGRGRSTARWSDKEFLYLDGATINVSANVFRANIDTGELTLLTTANKIEGMLYGLFTAPNCPYIVALENLGEGNTLVNLMEVFENNARVIWSHTVEEVLHTAVWDCERLLFKNEVGSLSVFELKNGKVEQNSDIPVLGRFYSPIATNNGVALVKGTEYKRALVMEGEQGYQGLTPHMNHKLAHPKYWDDERILFLSDESGEVQLKRIELANRELRLVASLSSLEAIGKMVLNQKMGLIAIGVGETIHIYKIDDALTQVQHLKTIAGINPYFYKDSITFARKSGNITNLYMMGLNSNDAQLIVPGGHSGMEKDGELYFDYWSKLGVWKYKEDGKHELTYELPFEIYSLVKSDEELIVQSLKNDYFKLTENGPEKLKFTRISWLKEVRNGTSLGVERNTAETVIYFANWR